MPMKENKLVDLVPVADLRGPAEIKAACFDAALNALVDEGHEDIAPAGVSRVVRSVLDTIIAHSQSPRTVDELTRIRGAGE